MNDKLRDSDRFSGLKSFPTLSEALANADRDKKLKEALKLTEKAQSKKERRKTYVPKGRITGSMIKSYELIGKENIEAFIAECLEFKGQYLKVKTKLQIAKEFNTTRYQVNRVISSEKTFRKSIKEVEMFIECRG